MSSQPSNAGKKIELFADREPKKLDVGKVPIKMFKNHKSKKQRKKIKKLRAKVRELEADLQRERHWRSAENDVHGCQVRSLRDQLEKAEKYHQKWHQAETQSSFLRGRLQEMQKMCQNINNIISSNSN